MKISSVAPSDTSSLLSLHRQTVLRDILEGKVVTVFMAIVTLWVLIGDDIRLIGTEKSADEAFYISFTICLFLFTAELILNSLFVEDYKFSFFFWLDVLSTVSMIFDIGWIMDNITFIYGGGADSATSIAKTSRAARVTRIVRLVRLIRLVRIVKLYKQAKIAAERKEAQ